MPSPANHKPLLAPNFLFRGRQNKKGRCGRSRAGYQGPGSLKPLPKNGERKPQWEADLGNITKEPWDPSPSG
jgi:hypothetical protein